VHYLSPALSSAAVGTVSTGTGWGLGDDICRRSSGILQTTQNLAGTASSLAFVSAQDLELVDPKVQAEMGRKRKPDEDSCGSRGASTLTQAETATNGGPLPAPTETESIESITPTATELATDMSKPTETKS
jgi:hypothetical protein